MVGDGRELCLIGFREATTVERCVFDLSRLFASCDFGLLNDDVCVELLAPYQAVVTDERCRVFIHPSTGDRTGWAHLPLHDVSVGLATRELSEIVPRKVSVRTI